MAEIKLRPLRKSDLTQLPAVITGYVTAETYAVYKHESETETTISLKLIPLPTPKTITYDHLDETELARLTAVVAEGISVGALVEGRLVGVAIASAEVWNRSLRVWEFHVAELYRGQGIGRQLIEKIMETAVAHNLRVIVCETQSSNVPAIRTYRKLSFVLDAIDLSFYSNEDVEKESVAVFMKRYVS